MVSKTPSTEARKLGQNSQVQLPVGTFVPGKPDLVYSPYATGKIIAVAGRIDVGERTTMIRFNHGEVILCPYTLKKFRVP